MGTEGLSTGIKQHSGRPHYAPKAEVSREAMAAFLFRLETQQLSSPKVAPCLRLDPSV